ncbi:hypothetical protein SISNIDRAFT_408934, partial [Sistotremastrum niveocremeum HHB9708]
MNQNPQNANPNPGAGGNAGAGQGNPPPPPPPPQPQPQVPPVPLALPAGMPVQRTKGAPKFDGSPKHIYDFIDEFETHALRVQLSDELKCRCLGKYANKRSRELWEQLPGYAANNWDQYKAQILSYYADVDEHQKFTVKDLLKLVRAQKKSKMRSLKDFSKYDRKFNRIALWLKARGKMAESEIDRHFEDGFPTKNGMGNRNTAALTCIFCGLSGHGIKECMTVTEYLNMGRAKRNDRGFVVTPTGDPIPVGTKGQSLKARLDEYLSTMKTLTSEKADTSVPEVLANVRPPNRSHPMQTRAQGPIFPNSTPPAPVPKASAPEEKEPENGPKFQYKSQAENPKLVSEAMHMCLQGNLSQITPAHIYAISPSIRSSTMNYLKNQRVEVHQFQSHEHHHHGDLIVSEDAISLREIDVLLNHSIPTKAVVDDGCQIITIREDLWRELEGTPVYPEEGMSMESADTSISQTLGKVRNLPMKIGPITFYIQAQVVRHSPVRLLLGMPFFALADCHKDIYRNGYMTITMTNPN